MYAQIGAGGADLDASVIEQCEVSADYGAGMTTLLRRCRECAILTTADQFTCQEITISFSGQIWEAPTDDEQASSDYIVLGYHPDANLADGPVYPECSDDSAGPGKP